MKKEPVRSLAVVQARMTSSRLPGKVLFDLCGAPMIVRQLERVKRARLLDGIVLATSSDPSDDRLASIVAGLGVAVYRGSLDNVLARFVGALDRYPARHVVRLTGDCPLADPNVIDAAIAHHFACGADITSNGAQPTFPDGLDVEVVTATALRRAGEEAQLSLEREHVTQFFYRRRDEFKVVDYKGAEDFSAKRWTVDHASDFSFVKSIYERLFPAKPEFGLWDVIQLLRENPELEMVNAGIVRNEGLARSIAKETPTGK